MRIIAVVLAVAVALIIPKVVQAAVTYDLVQTDGIRTLASFGKFPTLEQCLAALKKEKAKGTVGLRCHSVGTADVPKPPKQSAKQQSAQPSSQAQAATWYFIARPARAYVYSVLSGPYTILDCVAVKDAAQITFVASGMIGMCVTQETMAQLKAAGATFDWMNYSLTFPK